MLETTSHGAWDCFLDLRGVGRVRFLPYPAGTREPLRVLKLHNWLAPVSPLNPKGRGHMQPQAQAHQTRCRTAAPSPRPRTPLRTSRAHRRGGRRAGRRRAAVILTHRHAHALMHTLTDTPGPGASSTGRTLVHVVQACDLEHLAAPPLQLQPHGRDLRELAPEHLGNVVAVAVPLGSTGAAEPKGCLCTGTVP